MKKQLLLTPAVLLLITLLASCSLQKRHYRPGFYFDRGKEIVLEANQQEKKSGEIVKQFSAELSIADSAKNENAVAEDLPVVSHEPISTPERFTGNATPVQPGEAEQMRTPRASSPSQRIPDPPEDIAAGSMYVGLLALLAVLLMMIAMTGASLGLWTLAVMMVIFSPFMILIAIAGGIVALIRLKGREDAKKDRVKAHVGIWAAVLAIVLLFLSGIVALFMDLD